MFFDHLVHGSSRRGTVKIFFHYMFYTGAVLLSVSIMVGMENSFDTLLVGIMAVASIIMIVGLIGGRGSA